MIDTGQQLGQDDSYLAVTVDAGETGAEDAYRARFGRDPQEVFFAGTCYLAGPVFEPQAIDAQELEQGRLF